MRPRFRAASIASGLLTLAGAGCSARPIRPENAGVLRLTRTIVLPNVRGRVDHLAIDRRNKRLYVAEYDNDTVQVVGLRRGRVAHTIRHLAHPQNTLVIPHRRMFAVSTAGDGRVRFYNTRNYKLLHTVSFGGDADNMRYMRSTKYVCVAYGDGGIAAINPRTFAVVWRIAVTGHPEAFAVAPGGRHIYVNAQEASQVQKLDIAGRKVVAKWRLRGASENFPLAYDAKNHLLFIGCRDPDKLVVLNGKSGREVLRLPLGGVSDDFYFDQKSRRLFAACGQGEVDVYQEYNAHDVRLVARVPTARGARTCLVLPREKLLYLAVPSGAGRPAEIRVYQIGGK